MSRYALLSEARKGPPGRLGGGARGTGLTQRSGTIPAIAGSIGAGLYVDGEYIIMPCLVARLAWLCEDGWMNIGGLGNVRWSSSKTAQVVAMLQRSQIGSRFQAVLDDLLRDGTEYDPCPEETFAGERHRFREEIHRFLEPIFVP